MLSRLAYTTNGPFQKGGGALKKTVGVQYAFLKGKANDMELKSKVKAFYKGAKSGVKTGYKGAKHQFKEIKQQLKTKVSIAIFISSGLKAFHYYFNHNIASIS